jgi:hypothetical protein
MTVNRAKIGAGIIGLAFCAIVARAFVEGRPRGTAIDRLFIEPDPFYIGSLVAIALGALLVVSTRR